MCKVLEDLKKENSELKKQLLEMKDRGNVSGWGQCHVIGRPVSCDWQASVM